MKKNSITNKITPCCNLPFSVIYWWVSNLTLNSESDRQFILSKISQGGIISIDAWKVLINSGTLEADASLTKAEFLAWFDCGKQPKCEQLKLIIEGYKISNWDSFKNSIEELNEAWQELENKLKLKYNNALETEAVDVIQRIDFETGNNVNYKKTATWYDGSLMDESKVDGYVYRYYNDSFYVMAFDNREKRALIYKKMSDFKNMSLTDFYLLKIGYYSYVQLNGYNVDNEYVKPVVYYLVSENLTDDGGEIINVRGSSFKATFGDKRDVSYYGGLERARLAEGNFLIVSTEIDLKGNRVEVVKKTLKFERGGLIKNGILSGNEAYLDAGRFKIFDYDSLSLTGDFTCITGWSYPEWWGLICNDINYDLADYVAKLNENFVSISLNSGYYYTKKGEMSIKNLKGVSKRSTYIDFNPQKNNTYLFTLGKPSGSVAERDYDWRTIEDLYININPTVRRHGITGIIVGAIHKPSISNVIIKANTENAILTTQEQEAFVDNPKTGVLKANIGIEFRGDSELTNISNLFTLCDIGMKFTEFTDFVQVYDYMNWAKSNGICAVYIAEGAVQSQNITFAGMQSYNEGLYGLYVEDSQVWGTLRNFLMQGARVEQLNGNVLRNGKTIAYSYRIGSSKMIFGAYFLNCYTAGSGNLFYIGETSRGSVTIDSLGSEIHHAYPLECSLNFTFGNEDIKDFKIYLKDVNIYSSKPNIFNNCRKIDMSAGSDTSETIVNSVLKVLN